MDECRLDGASAAEVSLPSQWSCSAWLAGPGLCPPHSESCSYRKALSVFCGVANPVPRVCRVHFLPPAMGQACIGPQDVFGSWQLLQVPAVVVEALGGLCKLNPRVQQKMFRNGVSRKVWGSPAECSAATF